MGVMSPPSVLTATLTSTLLYCLTKLSIQLEFTSGTVLMARAAAFIIKSFTESLKSLAFSLSSLRSLWVDLNRVFIPQVKTKFK